MDNRIEFWYHNLFADAGVLVNALVGEKKMWAFINFRQIYKVVKKILAKPQFGKWYLLFRYCKFTYGSTLLSKSSHKALYSFSRFFQPASVYDIFL
jgi:hypothetical protein